MAMFEKQKWIILAVIAGIITMWLVRYEAIAVPPDNIMFLDRWTGELVIPGGADNGKASRHLHIGN